MDYGQHFVATLVCFVKAEGGRGLLSRRAFVRGAFVRGLISRGLYPTPEIIAQDRTAWKAAVNGVIHWRI